MFVIFIVSAFQKMLESVFPEALLQMVSHGQDKPLKILMILAPLSDHVVTDPNKHFLFAGIATSHFQDSLG